MRAILPFVIFHHFSCFHACCGPGAAQERATAPRSEPEMWLRIARQPADRQPAPPRSTATANTTTSSRHAERISADFAHSAGCSFWRIAGDLRHTPACGYVLAAEAAGHERRVRRQRVVALAIVGRLAAAGWLLYHGSTDSPPITALQRCQRKTAYSPEVWECVIDIFEHRPRSPVGRSHRRVLRRRRGRVVRRHFSRRK